MSKVLKSSIGILCALALFLTAFPAIVMTTEPLTAEAVTHLPVQRQWDAKWKNYYIGGRTMYDTACGIFSIVNAVGWLTGQSMDVMEVGRWAYSIKAFNYSSGGTTRSLLYPKLQAKYGATYGFTVDCNGSQGYWAGASSSLLKNHLAGGGTAIAHVKGHFIAVVDYDPNTNKFRVFDSAPSSSRGSNVYGEYGLGDVWLSETHLKTTTKMTIDWFCLLTSTTPVEPEDTAEKIGTWQLNSKAPTSDPLNVREGPGTSYTDVGDLVEGDIVYTSELSGSWGKVKKMDGSVEGWASVANYADYIGVDVLGGTPSLAWGDMNTFLDEYGQRTIINNSATETVGYDLLMPIDIGTDTTPFMSLQITPNYGSGYYFGITQNGSGYFMMRDCNSSDQLVVAQSAPYMVNQETLEIDLRDWWKPEGGERINAVRIYVAPSSSITVNYFYFAATQGKVVDTTYNLVRQATPIVNENLMTTNGLAISDRTKAGSYSYNNGKLVVTSNSDKGYEVTFDVNKDFKPAEVKNWLFNLTATTGFDVKLTATTSAGDWDFGLVADFWPALCDALDNGYLPAETYNGVCDIQSCYTWNNIMPSNGVSTIKKVTVVLAGQGTVTLNSLQVSNTTDLVTYADGLSKQDQTTGALKGDVDQNGSVTTADARDLLMLVLGGGTIDDSMKAIADYDGDGIVSTTDARKMLSELLMV